MLLWGGLLVPGAGCERLNPDWCDRHATCTGAEYCDPSTNSCRPREAGADLGKDAAADHAVVDLAPADGRPDMGPKPDMDPTLDPKPTPDTKPTLDKGPTRDPKPKPDMGPKFDTKPKPDMGPKPWTG